MRQMEYLPIHIYGDGYVDFETVLDEDQRIAQVVISVTQPFCEKTVTTPVLKLDPQVFARLCQRMLDSGFQYNGHGGQKLMDAMWEYGLRPQIPSRRLILLSILGQRLLKSRVPHLLKLPFMIPVTVLQALTTRNSMTFMQKYRFFALSHRKPDGKARGYFYWNFPFIWRGK